MGIRSALRARFFRVVDEVVARHRHEQTADLVAEFEQRLRGEADRVIKEVRDGVITEVRDIEMRDRRDTFAAAEREAVASTARFVERTMSEAVRFPYPHATLRHALSLAPSGGMALEFGVFSGTTLKIIAAARDSGGVYGFDSFEGLPETWRVGFRAGAFDVAELPDVAGAELVVGLFDDTLPGFLAEHPGAVDFLHLDADLYSSTAAVLAHVGPRLRPGSVLVFDEFFNYPGWEHHEARAWQEYVAMHDVGFRYEAYTVDNEQVVVRLT